METYWLGVSGLDQEGSRCDSCGWVGTLLWASEHGVLGLGIVRVGVGYQELTFWTLDLNVLSMFPFFKILRDLKFN